MPNSYDKDRDCPHSNCIVEAIGWFSDVLKSKTAPVSEKRLAVYFVVHLVGDIHQPLHAGFKDDHIGTKVKVTYRGQEQTLHRLRDSGILDSVAGTAEEMAGRLNTEFNDPQELSGWESGTPEQWANESLALTIEHVYPLPESPEISEEYATRALPVLRKRLVQSGLRLARLLNDTLK
jgi:hypothetical protein